MYQYMKSYMNNDVELHVSYALSREYRVMRNRNSRFLFTNEDRLCANLRVQEQSVNMTSQCQYLPSSCDVPDQLWWRHNAKSEKAVLSAKEISDRQLF